jgi:hypothetical protein
MEVNIFEDSSNTKNPVFGKGKGFPRMIEPTTPCLLDAIRIVLAGGTRTNNYIVKAIMSLGWLPEGRKDPLHYMDNVLSQCFKKRLIIRSSPGHYHLPSDDRRPVQWATKYIPALIGSENPDNFKPPVSQPVAQAVQKPVKGNGQSKSKLAVRGTEPTINLGPIHGSLHFRWAGSKEPLFTVDFELFPSK